MALADVSHNDSSGPVQRVMDFMAQRDQDKQNKQIVTWAKKQYDTCKRQRLKQERQWYMNLAFLKGHHYVDWVQTTASVSGFKLWTPPAPPWRVRIVINKIRPVIRKEIAKLTSSKPNWTVVPNSTEDQDRMAARSAELIFTYLYDENRIQNKLKKSVFWSSSTGTGYLKAYWDAQKLCGQGQYEYLGDIVYEVLDPFHVYVPDLLEEEIENQPYVIHAQTRSMEWIKSRYPGLKIQPDVQAASGILEDAYLNLTSAKMDAKDQVLLLEFWIKPQKLAQFPEGAYILIAADQIIQMIPKFPYMHRMYPFAKIDHIPSGQYYATSVIEDLISLNREINKTRSQLIENKNMMGKPQFLYPKGSIDVAKMVAEPGQGIPYEPGLGEPRPFQPPEIPSYVLQHLDMMNNDFDDLSAQHEVSRGNAPGSITAATAIGALQEQDDSQLSTTTDSIEDAIRKLGLLSLSYVEEFWEEDRMVKIVGEDSYFDARVLKGSAIQGNKDVRVEAGSALSTSKAAKQALVMDLMNNQHVPPQLGLEVLSFPGIEKLFSELETDKRQAQRENIKMAGGMGEQQPVIDPNTQQPMIDPLTGMPQMETVFPPNTWDNNPIHIEEHNAFRKSPQYEILPPEIQQIFEYHVTLHQQAEQLAQMQAAMGMPPTGELPSGGGQEVSQQQADQYQQPLPGM